MDRVKRKLDMLKIELNKQSLSKERIMEIIETTKELAMKIDEIEGISGAYGMIIEKNKNETKYWRKRAKLLVNTLIEYIG